MSACAEYEIIVSLIIMTLTYLIMPKDHWYIKGIYISSSRIFSASLYWSRKTLRSNPLGSKIVGFSVAAPLYIRHVSQVLAKKPENDLR